MVLDRSEMRNCPECGAPLKIKNLPRHLKRNHGIEIGNSTAEIERAFKRKRPGIMARFRNNVRIQIAFAIIVTVILGMSVYGMISIRSDSGPGFRPANNFDEILDYDPEHIQVKIYMSKLSHEARFYSYNSNGVNIRVFALLGSDEKPRVAFDASENSFSEKRGFRQNGDKMVDNAYNWEIDIDTIGVVTMNNEYAPAPLYWEYCCGETKIAINLTNLETHRYMFE